jgi:hypothetical protein
MTFCWTDPFTGLTPSPCIGKITFNDESNERDQEPILLNLRKDNEGRRGKKANPD